MDSEFFIQDIIRRTYNLFRDRYSKHPSLNNTQFEMEVDRNNFWFGGSSEIDANVLRMKIYKGTVENIVESVNAILQARTSEKLKRITQNDTQDLISAEGIIFRQGGFMLFDSKDRDEFITNIIIIFIYRFVICHEFGHLLHGHHQHYCKCINDRLRLIPMEFSECDMKGVSDQSKLDIYTLEWDADCFAAAESMFEVLFLYINFDTQVQKPEYTSPKELFLWWGFAIVVLFRKLQEIYYERNDNMKVLYTPAVRFRNVTNTAVETLDRFVGRGYSSDEIKDMKEMIGVGIAQAEDLLEKCENTDYGWSKYSEESIQDALSKLINNWKELKKILKKTSYLDLDED